MAGGFRRSRVKTASLLGNWNAKDLAKLLGYRQYTNFTGAIRKAEVACKESGEAVSDHFLHVQEMTPGGKGATRRYPTVHLSRFACYLLVENADPEGRPIVALGQKYFAIQTRRQELTDELTLSAFPTFSRGWHMPSPFHIVIYSR